jgi:hypothetical protein
MHPDASDAFPSERSSCAAAGATNRTKERNNQCHMIISIAGGDEIRFAPING